MTPTIWQNCRVIQGDWIEQLRTLADESVQCVVTSPPYWGLRDYGVAGQLGLEKTPEEYVEKIVEGFREIRRVMREDGTCWVNLGDSYAAGGGFFANAPSNINGSKQSTNRGSKHQARTPPNGLKSKDLVGIPWRVAFALQADGWYLRSDIIWHKPNPMPESVTDRPTKAHEYIFLITKSARYFYDAEAIKEQSDYVHRRGTCPVARNGTGRNDYDREIGDMGIEGARNKRTVWTVPSAPYPESHFATFPPDLIKPCILAGTSARGCCPKCGAPWERESISKDTGIAASGNKEKRWGQNHTTVRANGAGEVERHSSIPWNYKSVLTLGWQPTCDCGETDTQPCAVLDPFGGSGTTGQVALELGRKAILIELNPAYVKLIEQRTHVTPGLPL